MKISITTILFFVATVFFSNEVSAQTLSSQNNSVSKQDTLLASGRIIKQPMETKKGESPYLFDYYFKTENQRYFVKYKGSNISTDTFDSYLNQNVKITYQLKYGDWDSNENEVKQSRVGSYIVILSFVTDNTK